MSTQTYTRKKMKKKTATRRYPRIPISGDYGRDGRGAAVWFYGAQWQNHAWSMTVAVVKAT